MANYTQIIGHDQHLLSVETSHQDLKHLIKNPEEMFPQYV